MTYEPLLMNHGLNCRLQLVTGKGGVGKTSLCAALALAHARQGKRPLVIELGHRSNLESLSAVQPNQIGSNPAQWRDGIWAMVADLKTLLQSYLKAHFPFGRLTSRALNNPSIDSFFHAAPAVYEIALMDFLTREVQKSGRKAFDPIIVDLDATGHAMMILELENVFSTIAKRGPLRTLLTRATTLLKNEALTSLHIVSLAEELPVQETAMLLQTLREKDPVALGSLFCNRLRKDVFTDSELLEVNAYLKDLPDNEQTSDQALLQNIALSQQHQNKWRNELADLTSTYLVELPEVSSSSTSWHQVETIAERITASMETAAL